MTAVSGHHRTGGIPAWHGAGPAATGACGGPTRSARLSEAGLDKVGDVTYITCAGKIP